MKEKILTVLPLKGKKRGGGDIYHAFKEYGSDINLLLQNLVSTTDGAPAMVGSRNGFVELCRKDK
jgi:hypothetical protein